MTKETNPSQVALCIMLAHDSHLAGVFLSRIVSWARYAHARIPNVAGEWIANDRKWWMREAQLSTAQYDRTIAKLADWGLIERRQWWFGRRNILYVRPTVLTVEYLETATTWDAANEFLHEICVNPQVEISKSTKPSSAKSTNSNGPGILANLGSAGLHNSKDNH